MNTRTLESALAAASLAHSDARERLKTAVVDEVEASLAVDSAASNLRGVRRNEAALEAAALAGTIAAFVETCATAGVVVNAGELGLGVLRAIARGGRWVS